MTRLKYMQHGRSGSTWLLYPPSRRVTVGVRCTGFLFLLSAPCFTAVRRSPACARPRRQRERAASRAAVALAAPDGGFQGPFYFY